MARKKLPYYVQELKRVESDTVESYENLTEVPRIMLAGIDTYDYVIEIAIGLLSIWREQNLDVVPFSVGPSFENLETFRAASANKVYTLDSFYQEESEMAYLLSHYVEGHDLALLIASENYYDSKLPYSASWAMEESSPLGSPADLAYKTNTPVVMVIDLSDLSYSSMAKVEGILEFKADQQIAGFIVTGVKADKAEYAKELLESEFGIPVFASFPSRLTDDKAPSLYSVIPEIAQENWRKNIESITSDLYKYMDLHRLLKLAMRATDLEQDFPDSLFKAQKLIGFNRNRFNLAVARDEAFNAYYQENLDILEEMGANIVYFSPMKDPILPKAVDGIYLGTGNLIKHLAEVSKNESLRIQIRRLAMQGMPILAEGTGAVYLADAYRNRTGVEWPLAGVLPSIVSSNYDTKYEYYCKMTSRRDDLLCKNNFSLRCLLGNEFIFEPNGASYRALIKGIGHQMEAFSTNTIWASQATLHFYASPIAVARFALRCLGENSTI